jgi:ankyrin repeat protein
MMNITPLPRAAWSGDVRLARRLLRDGAFVDERSDSGLTPLMFAAKEGKASAARLFIEAGANLDARARSEPFRGMSPIHLAVTAVGCSARAVVRIVRLLIECGANLNLRDSHGWSPLRSAMAEGRSRVVSLLLEAGAKALPPNKGSNATAGRGRPPAR